jgi:hypothetical protein
MATRRPTILPLRDRPEPRPRPYDLLPLADPAGRYSPFELTALTVLAGTLPVLLFAAYAS